MRRLGQLMGIGLIAAGVFIGVRIGVPLLKFELGTPAYRLETLWQKDLSELQAGGHLPKEWSDIREIQLNPTTDDAKTWLKEVRTPITLKNDGKHKLDILIFSWEDGGRYGAVLIHHLLELPSENMIFEVTRSYDVTKSKLDDILTK